MELKFDMGNTIHCQSEKYGLKEKVNAADHLIKQYRHK